ncbi:MAG: glycosyltransferase family 2 protein [Candidatus Tritonobacter lacicola]|nr:glycosyltransferase family 2 protein [Candidatus Tritonobacter lacicola]
MKVSFIIVNWNTRDLLDICLDSIHRTVFGCEYEVLVVDNGSTDGSLQMLREDWPDVRAIGNERNLGFAAAVNRGLREAKGDFYILLNTDAKLMKGAVETLIKFMRSDSRIGAAGPQLLNDDGSLQNSFSVFPTLLTEIVNKSLLKLLFPRKFPGKHAVGEEPVEVDSLIGACFCIRREAVEQVGALDEDYFFFLEETDWCLRMRKAGWKIYLVPSALVVHLQGKSADLAGAAARIEYYRSRYIYFLKHRGRGAVRFLKAFTVVRLAVDLVANCLSCFFIYHRKGLERYKRRISTYCLLLRWHLKGCSGSEGLRPG